MLCSCGNSICFAIYKVVSACKQSWLSMILVIKFKFNVSSLSLRCTILVNCFDSLNLNVISFFSLSTTPPASSLFYLAMSGLENQFFYRHLETCLVLLSVSWAFAIAWIRSLHSSFLQIVNL